jgi:hypothetical protein
VISICGLGVAFWGAGYRPKVNVERSSRAILALRS